MKMNIGAAVTGLGLTCSGGLAQPTSAQPITPPFKIEPSLTTYLNGDGDVGVLAGLTLNQGAEFRLRTLLEKPSSVDSFTEQDKFGLDLNLNQFTLNTGVGLNRGDLDFSRLSFGYQNTDGEGLRFSYADTPLRQQYMIDARIDLNHCVAIQGIIDDQGDSRARLIFKHDIYGASLALGSSDGETVGNASWNSDKVWFSGSYGDRKGLQGRFVIGDIPKNRSDLYGEVSRPGVNDISIFPDQTVRNAIGEKPTFGLLALAPNTFLAEEVGSAVLDLGGQEHGRLSARGSFRLGTVGAVQNSWIAVGGFYELKKEVAGVTIEAGAKVLGGDLRVLSEISERGSPNVGVLFSIRF